MTPVARILTISLLILSLSQFAKALVDDGEEVPEVSSVGTWVCAATCQYTNFFHNDGDQVPGWVEGTLAVTRLARDLISTHAHSELSKAMDELKLLCDRKVTDNYGDYLEYAQYRGRDPDSLVIYRKKFAPLVYNEHLGDRQEKTFNLRNGCIQQ